MANLFGKLYSDRHVVQESTNRQRKDCGLVLAVLQDLLLMTEFLVKNFISILPPNIINGF